MNAVALSVQQRPCRLQSWSEGASSPDLSSARVDVWRVHPGPGPGGHCIPVDPFYLSWKAKGWDFQTRFELAGEIMGMPYHVVVSVASALNRQRKVLNGACLLVLGVAYKKDLRESPALTIIELIQREGSQVSYNDLYIPFIGKGGNTTCK